MTEPLQNQSDFMEQASQIQAPPELQKKTSPSRNRIILVIGGLLLVLVILMALLAANQPSPPPETPLPTPTIHVSPTPSVLEKKLSEVDAAVENANPEKPIIDQPPLDMNIKF